MASTAIQATTQERKSGRIPNWTKPDWSAIFGYDIFISYARQKASAFALRLKSDLADRDFNCFLDKDHVPSGLSLEPRLTEALSKTKVLVVIVDSGALASDWVPLEIEEFRRLHQDRPVIPIDIDRSFVGLPPTDDAWGRFRKLNPVWLQATGQDLADGRPSPALVDDIAHLFTYLRAHRARRIVTGLIALTLLAATAIAVWKAKEATEEQHLAEYQAAEATRQKGLAVRNEGIAKAKEKEAVKQKGIAENQTNVAEIERANAEQQSRIATARQMTAEAELLLRDQRAELDVPVLLAAESLLRDANVEGDVGLRDATALLPHPLVAFLQRTPVSRVVLDHTGQHVMVFSRGTIRLVDVAAGREIWRAVLKGPGGTFAASQDCRFAAIDGGDGVYFFDAKGSREGHLLASGHAGVLAFSPDGQSLAIGLGDNSVRLFDLIQGTERWKCPFGPSNMPAGVMQLKYPNQVSSLALSRDGRYVAAGGGDGTARVLEAATGKEISRMPHQFPVYAVAFSPDGKMLITGSANNVAQVFDAASGKRQSGVIHEKASFLPQSIMQDLNRATEIHAVAFSADGRYAASGSRDDSVYVFEPLTGRIVTRLALDAAVNELLFSPVGPFLAAASDSRTARFFEASTGKETTRFVHKDRVQALALSGDGNYLATGGADGAVKIFKAPIQTNSYLDDQQAAHYAKALSADGSRVGAGTAVGFVSVLDRRSGQRIMRGKPAGPAQVLAFSHDGAMIAIDAGTGVFIYDVASGKEQAELKPSHRTSSNPFSCAIEFSPNGKHAAVAWPDSGIQIFRVSDGQPARAGEQAQSGCSLQFSSDGRHVATAGRDRKIHLFAVSDGEQEQQIDAEADVVALAYSSDG